jgi:hypothetical protein
MKRTNVQTARIEFEVGVKRRHDRREKPSPPCRVLAVERLAYNLRYGDSATCPFIRLKGRWLAQAGFRVGARVVVTVRRRCLVIRPLREATPPRENRSRKER